jgi:hypothetical protein
MSRIVFQIFSAASFGSPVAFGVWQRAARSVAGLLL